MPWKLYTSNFCGLAKTQLKNLSLPTGWGAKTGARKKAGHHTLCCVWLAALATKKSSKMPQHSTCEAIVPCTPPHDHGANAGNQTSNHCPIFGHSPKLVVFPFLSLFAAVQQQQIATASAAAVTKRGAEVREGLSDFYYYTCSNNQSSRCSSGRRQ